MDDQELLITIIVLPSILIGFAIIMTYRVRKKFSKLSNTAKVVWCLHWLAAMITAGFLAQAPEIEDYERDDKES